MGPHQSLTNVTPHSNQTPPPRQSFTTQYHHYHIYQIELKAQIKKLMTSPEVSEALDRLEIQGEPVWGLSTEEREMIVMCREKIKEC